MCLYSQLTILGADMDSHESDLYVRATPEALATVRASGRSYSLFRSELDGRMWIDVPFAYLPWWERRAKHAQKGA